MSNKAELSRVEEVDPTQLGTDRLLRPRRGRWKYMGVRFLKAVKIGGYIFVIAWGTNSDCFKMLKMFNPPNRNAAYRQF